MSLLAREYDDLRSRRVALRRRREELVKATRYAPMNRWGVDGWHNQIATVDTLLRGTESRWSELCALLRRPQPGPPVQLNAPVRRSTVTRATVPGYMTKVMLPR